MKRRVFLIVIDSVGIGGAPDADQYFNGDVPDRGANTVLHIIEEMRERGGVHWPNLSRLGLGQAIEASVGVFPKELEFDTPLGLGGTAREYSKGKDTPSGHWEIAGLPVPWDWHYFSKSEPVFPRELADKIFDKTGVEFIGNKHASGTSIIEELGEEHIRTRKPIAYTSVDSVFQIAAHENYYGLEELYKLCEAVAEIVHPMRVGRVIARPFIGEIGSFTRTSNRHDFAIEPPELTILDLAQEAGHRTIAIGKIRDIFSGHGIDEAYASKPDDELFDHLLDVADTAPDGALTFVNFVEFDSKFGHLRDVEGYAGHLSWFDRRLGELIPRLRQDDLLMITADHGNDPSWSGTDHTREQVPVLVWAPSLELTPIGNIDFTDIGATVLDFLGVSNTLEGKSVIK